MVAFAIAILVENSLEGIIENQRERNYARFVKNVDGLTNTFRGPVEECAIISVEKDDDECLNRVFEEYRNQFGSLIKLFGYESHMLELYQYWQFDLEYWYNAKKIQMQYTDTELIQSKLEEILRIQQKAKQERLDPDFANFIESK